MKIKPQVFRIKLVGVKAVPKLFAETFMTCFKEGVFPEKWRKQKLVLISK